MLWLSRIRLRLRTLLHRESLDEALSQELEFHLAQQRAEYMAQGMDEADADAAARRAFGGVLATAEECRDQRQTRWLEDLVQDARYAVRSFRKAPAFASVAVLTLALGIGANTAFFSAAYGIMFRPLPYPGPDRLVNIEEGPRGVGPVTSLRDLSRTSEYAGYLPNSELNLQLSGEAWRVRAAAATWNLARVLGVSPSRGRWFSADEERPGQNRVAVLSDRTWRERFSADPAILGRRILLNELPFEIVGVMPAGFAFPSPATELWVPVRLDSRDVGYMWGDANLWPIGRLREGAAPATAQAELKVAIDRIRGMFPWRMPDEWAGTARVAPYSDTLVAGVRPKLFALSAAALLLLLIACGDVANLLLARTVRREREFAMRAALGANRARLLRQAMTENLVLVVAGGVAGVLAAALVVKLLPQVLPKDTPRLHEIAVDPVLFAAAAASMLLTAVLFSAAPLFRVWRLGRQSLAGQAATASRHTSGVSLALIGFELALATVLLIGAGLMGRTLWSLAHIDSGVHATGVVVARVSAGPNRCGTETRCWSLLQDLNRSLLDLPGARSVNWSNLAPLDKEISAVSVDVQDYPKPPGAPSFVHWETAATPGYFRTLGIPLRDGRFFTDADRTGSAPVIILSESTAKRYWPKQSAIGKHIRPSSDREWMTVVGVVGDVAQYSLTGFPDWIDGVQYMPLAQYLPRVTQSLQLTLFVESSRPEAAMAGLPSSVRQRFPDVVPSRVASLEGVRSDSVADQRSTARLLALFAAVGLVLGIAGVYGVVSHRAAQRTREIGIRIAMGATPARVVVMVVREVLIVALTGCGAGIAAGVALSRFLRSLLFGVTPHDTLAFALFPAILLAAAVIAAALPGCRASRADPALTLREE